MSGIPPEATNRYPPVAGSTAIPTMGLFRVMHYLVRRAHPIFPRRGRLPESKIRRKRIGPTIGKANRDTTFRYFFDDSMFLIVPDVLASFYIRQSD